MLPDPHGDADGSGPLDDDGVPAVSGVRGARPWLVGKVEALRQVVDDAEERLREAVEVARAAGASWDDVGDALGVTRQSASRRYGS